ncbi:MAG TPA: M48 family metallopeptidase [Steroidobacteraceae bacterium]|nr:M48 family metallopeptidase [Steroidobacteraceae bacterium]
MKIFASIVLSCLLGLCEIAGAQTPDVVSGDTVASSVEPEVGQVIDYRLPPDKLARSQALYETRLAMFVVGTIYSLLVIAVVLALRLAPKFRDRAERLSARSFVQALVFVPLLIVSIDLLSLPLGLYGHHLQRSYGLSVQSWGSWLGDWVKGEGLGAALAVVLVWGLYAIIRRSPTRWWLYCSLAFIPVFLLLVLIQPMYIDPLFNKFDSLEARQPQLVGELEKVMHRGGLVIERSRMFEMQASDKVTTYNAYVTGIGASKRVVVWDTTSRDMSIPETLFVFGHEQGHYVLHHIWLSIGLGILGTLLALYLIHRSIGFLLARFGQRWGIRSVGDWASLPVLMLLLSVFSLVGQPFSAAFSRALEHEADVYGLEAIHGLVPNASQAAASAFQKLGEKGLTYPDPHPLFVLWAFDHPHSRIACNSLQAIAHGRRGGRANILPLTLPIVDQPVEPIVRRDGYFRWLSVLRAV